MPHRDVQNQSDTMNLVVCLDDDTLGKGGELWIQNLSGTEYRQVQPSLAPMAGQVHDIRHKPMLFNPSLWHGTEPWTGRRLVATAFTAGLWHKLSRQDKSHLRMLGFPMPKESAANAADQLPPQQEQSSHRTSSTAKQLEPCKPITTTEPI